MNKIIHNLTSPQKDIYFDQIMHPDTSIYNIGACVTIRGKINPDAFENAYHALVIQNDVLRSHVDIAENGDPFVYYSDEKNPAYEFIDLSQADRPGEEAFRLVRKDFAIPFDLDADNPLHKFYLIKIHEAHFIFYSRYHHLITDGWGTSLIYARLTGFYNEYLQTGEISIGDLFSYRDFADYDENYQQSDAYQKDITYWKDRLQAMPEPEVQSEMEKVIKSGRRSIVINREQYRELQQFCKERGCTVFHFFLALLFTYFGRIREKDALLIGVPILNRPKARFKKTVGLFTNILPLLISQDRNRTFTDLMVSIKDSLRRDFRYQSLSVGSILKNSLSGNFSRSFPDLFLSYEKHDYDFDFQGCQSEVTPLTNNQERATLSMYVREFSADQDVKIDFDHNLGKQDSDQIENFVESFEVLLKDVLKHPDSSYMHLDIIGEQDRKRLRLQDDNALYDVSWLMPVPSLFEQQVLKTKNRIALRCKEKSFTYEELNKRVNQLANFLICDKGILKNDLVGICTDRSELSVIGILGILKAGGAYVPIDPLYPKERKKYILEDCQPKAVLTEKKYLPDFPEADLTDLRDRSLAGQPDHDPSVEYDPDSLIYVIYTSGTTGTPKGVPITHKSVSNLCSWLHSIIYQQANKPLNALLTASYNFDASVQQLFAPLISGSMLFIIDQETRIDPDRYIDQLVKSDIDVFDITPSFLEDVVTVAANRGITLSGKYCLIGGEVLNKQLAADFHRVFKSSTLINVYGVTEAAVNSTFHIIGESLQGSITLGKALPGTKVQVLDSRLQPQPSGGQGEICISGVGLATGYLNKQELTVEKFVPNPYRSSETLYRTGDAGRLLSDGTIEYLGRTDNQIKFKGIRLEPGEIEANLLKIPAITAAKVLLKTQQTGDEMLVAYYVSKQRIDTKEISKRLRRNLPVTIIPSFFVHLTRFPLTLNGKTDISKLPEPEVVGSWQDKETTMDADQELLSIWESVLGNQVPIGEKNFFELGGNSLKAVRMLAAVRKIKNVTLELREVFENPTIAEMTHLISEKMRENHKVIPNTSRQQLHRASHSQKRLWLFDQHADEQTTYSMLGAFHLKGRLQVDMLEKSLWVLIERHESLRTVFVELDSEIYQKILDTADYRFSVELIELEEDEVDQEITETLLRPFDLTQGPLLRVKLARLADEEFILIISMAHIISDGWSVEIMKREISETYNVFLQGRKAEFPSLSIQYRDYSEWFDDYLQQKEGLAQKAFWQDKLKGPLPVLDIPTDHERPVMKTHRGSESVILLNREYVSRLSELAFRENCTQFLAFTTLIKVLLFKYTGQQDLILGTPVSGRVHPSLHDQVGLYVNNLSIRSHLAGESGFLHNLHIVRDAFLEASAHADYPFDKIVEDCDITFDPGRSPVFDHMILFEQEEETLDFSGVETIPYSVEERHSKYDLLFRFVRKGEDLELRIIYNKDLFSRSRTERMLSHLENLMCSVSIDAEMPLKSLDFLGEAERNQLLTGFNDTETGFTNKPLTRLFEEQCLLRPDEDALADDNRLINFQELNEKANALARFFIARYQIGPGTRVALLLEKSEMLVVSILAVLKAGGAYVPIDTDYPNERIAFVLQNSSASLLIAEKALIGKDSFEVDCIDPVLLQEMGKTYSKKNLDNSASPEDLAYVIYTSGSTGQPKGVMVEHQAVVNRIEWMWKTYSFDAHDVVLQKTPHVFDVSVWELFLPLCYGCKMVLCRKEIAYSPALLTKLIADQKVTTLHFVPSVLNSFLEGIVKTDVYKFASVRQVISSGEALPATTVRKFYQKFNNTLLHNLYGPTEAAVDVTFYQTGPGDQQVPIGKPISNIRIYILNENMKPVPIGFSGELCIAGIGLARGYINRVELTDNSFVDNPFEAGARLYRTGDIARWQDDGTIAYIGRRDHQVKIRGYRVELGEISGTIRLFEGIIDAIVRPFKDLSGETQLMAYVIAADELKRDDLRRFLLKKLPYFSLPLDFIKMTKFPLTPNGKLDHDNLPDPNAYLKNSQKEAQKALSNAERKMIEIWKQVLGTKEVGVNDNFFALGGHSINATRLIARIHKERQVQLNIRTIYQHPTIKELLAEIDAHTRTNYESISQVAESDSYGVSYAQQRYFVLNSQFPGLYNIAGLFQINGEPDQTLLENAFTQLIARHEVLRTSFIVEDDQVRQVVHTMKQVNFEVQKVFRQDREDLENCYREFAADPFDLGTFPLIRATLIIVSDQPQALLVSLPHIVADGWTLGLLKKDLQLFYQAGSQKQAPALSPLDIQYKDYVSWHRAKAQGHADFWTKLYEQDFRVPVLPADGQRTPEKKNEGKVTETLMESSAVARIQEFAVSHHCTVADILLSSFFLLLHKWCDRKDMIVGVISAGRNHIQTEHLAGVMINFLPVRWTFDVDNHYHEYLDAFNKFIAEVYEHQDYPFELMTENLARQSNLAENPFFNVLFNFHSEEKIFLSGENQSKKSLNLTDKTPKSQISLLDLRMEIKENEKNDLVFQLEYNSALFKESSVENLMTKYFKVIEDAINGGLGLIKDINLFTEQEERELIEKRNNSVIDMKPVKPEIKIVSSFTSDPLIEYLTYWLKEAEEEAYVTLTPYNHTFQSLLNLSSEDHKDSDFIFILVRFEDWLRDQKETTDNEKIRVLDEIYSGLTSLLSRLDIAARCVVSVFPHVPSDHSSAINDKLKELASDWKTFISSSPQLNMLDLTTLAQIYHVEEVFDPIADDLGHVVFSQEYYAAMGTFMARKIIAANNKPFKVIVLDCDNLLWKGVCGEDTAEKVIISAHHQFLHQFMIDRYHEGFLLALASKNNEEDVWEVFEKREEMLLKKEHLITWRINWEHKSQNIMQMSSELKLGLDSFIFIDDSPFECESVQDALPEVLTLQSPDHQEYRSFFNHIWAFDRFGITEEDSRRNELYKAESERSADKVQYDSNEEFIKSLAIEVTLRDLDHTTIERARQLSLRTNQFNLNGKTLTEAELRNKMADKHFHCLTVHVRDRFGDYGMSGLIIARRGKESVSIESFFLSCRVLGRGVEKQVLKTLLRRLQISKPDSMEFKFSQTEKNEPVRKFLDELIITDLSYTS